MTANDALDLLLRLTIASSLSLVLVLLLRRPLRALFGAGAAWQLWLVVPAATLAAALPAMKMQHTLVAGLSSPLQFEALTAPVRASAAFNWPGLLLVFWLCGAITIALLFARAQRSFVASLGRLEPCAGIWYAQSCGEGPVLLGMRQPRIVVPADFDSRYDAFEQSLIIEHEKRHAERGDPLANACIAFLRCLFWFNPLVHAAASRCRFDQELACDADVMRRLPGHIKAYAAAMLKTQDGGAQALATCHWQSSHPLKERIMHLNKSSPAGTRRVAGRLIIACLLCCSATGAVLARADTASAGTTYEVLLKIEFKAVIDAPAFLVRDDKLPRVLVQEGEHFTVRSEKPEGSVEGEFWVSDAGDGKVFIQMKVKNKEEVLGEPKLLTRLGHASAVGFTGKDKKEGYKITMVVNRASSTMPAL